MSPEFVSLSDCASSSRLHEIIVELQRRDWKCFWFSSHRHHHLILSPFSHSSMLFTRILYSWFIQDFDRNDRVMNWNVSLEANRTCKLTWKVFHWCRGISILPCRFFHHCTRGNPKKVRNILSTNVVELSMKNRSMWWMYVSMLHVPHISRTRTRWKVNVRNVRRGFSCIACIHSISHLKWNHHQVNIIAKFNLNIFNWKFYVIFLVHITNDSCFSVTRLLEQLACKRSIEGKITFSIQFDSVEH